VGEVTHVAQKRRHADGLGRDCCRRIGFRERSILALLAILDLPGTLDLRS